MSIYVLRSDNFVKIGFSDDLGKRVRAIIGSTPVPVEFVGHMPGGRDLEKHLHKRFAESRFSGEWFVETECMRSAFSALLTPNMPKLPKPDGRRKVQSNHIAADLVARVSNTAAARWPEKGRIERLKLVASKLGWNWTRLRDFYYGDDRIVLRAFELQELEQWLSSPIAPEIADNTDEVGA